MAPDFRGNEDLPEEYFVDYFAEVYKEVVRGKVVDKTRFVSIGRQIYRQQIKGNRFIEGAQEDSPEFFSFLDSSIGASRQHLYRAARLSRYEDDVQNSDPGRFWFQKSDGPADILEWAIHQNYYNGAGELKFTKGANNRGISEHFEYRTVEFVQTDPLFGVDRLTGRELEPELLYGTFIHKFTNPSTRQEQSVALDRFADTAVYGAKRFLSDPCLGRAFRPPLYDQQGLRIVNLFESPNDNPLAAAGVDPWADTAGAQAKEWHFRQVHGDDGLVDKVVVSGDEADAFAQSEHVHNADRLRAHINERFQALYRVSDADMQDKPLEEMDTITRSAVASVRKWAGDVVAAEQAAWEAAAAGEA